MYANIMRLTKDVEVKTVTSKEKKEISVCNNRVAIPVGDKTTYINITAWGGLADLLGQYLRKGDEFYGEGELRNDTVPVYNKDGEEKELQTAYLLLETIKFTHGNKREQQAE